MLVYGNTGVYANAQLALTNPRPVMYVPTQNGWYMVRETAVMRIVQGPVELPNYLHVTSLEVNMECAPATFEAGAHFKLQKIDWSILRRFITDARYYSQRFGTELHAEVYWCTTSNRYELHVPKQTATRWRVIPEHMLLTDDERVKVMEIHSHHVWAAQPSNEDDAHEQSPILYAIVGKVHDLFPDLTVRTCLNRVHIPIRPCDVFESPFDHTESSHLPYSQVRVKGGNTV